MKLKLTLLSATLCASMSVFGQQFINGRGCATALPPEGWDQAFNKKVEEHKQQIANGRQMSAYTIPVVVHVIYGTQAVGVYPNLSSAQINSQISVMNADYAGTGYNVGNLATTGFSATGAANTGVSFCLAELDPSGNPMTEIGIDRVSYTTLGTGANPTTYASQSTFQSYIDNTVKPATIWDPTRYFNIWVTDVNTNVGLLGYSTFPALSTLPGLVGSNSTMSNDGIWVWAKSFGNTGTLYAPYNKGRTASHETGHYLGLRHIGGDGQANGTGGGNASGDCTATDYCNDTPPQKGGFGGGQYGQNYGAPTYPLHSGVCSASAYGDMFMNFMDYTDDAICTMFTPDQVTRMHTALDNSPYRVNLTASSATMCSLPATMPVASIQVPSSGCIDTLMQSGNQSTGFPVPTYSWSASPSGGVTFSPSATSPTPVIEFTSPGTYSIVMTASNSAGTNSAVSNIVVSDCGSGNYTGITKNSLLYRSVSLSPNPSSGLVNITTTLPSSQDLVITIHNSLGQQVFSNKYSSVGVNTFNLNLENYPVGVYSVTISSNTEKVVKRLILSK